MSSSLEQKKATNDTLNGSEEKEWSTILLPLLWNCYAEQQGPACAAASVASAVNVLLVYELAQLRSRSVGSFSSPKPFQSWIMCTTNSTFLPLPPEPASASNAPVAHAPAVLPNSVDPLRSLFTASSSPLLFSIATALCQHGGSSLPSLPQPNFSLLPPLTVAATSILPQPIRPSMGSLYIISSSSESSSPRAVSVPTLACSHCARASDLKPPSSSPQHLLLDIPCALPPLPYLPSCHHLVVPRLAQPDIIHLYARMFTEQLTALRNQLLVLLNLPQKEEELAPLDAVLPAAQLIHCAFEPVENESTAVTDDAAAVPITLTENASVETLDEEKQEDLDIPDPTAKAGKGKKKKPKKRKKGNTEGELRAILTAHFASIAALSIDSVVSSGTGDMAADVIESTDTAHSANAAAMACTVVSSSSLAPMCILSPQTVASLPPILSRFYHLLHEEASGGLHTRMANRCVWRQLTKIAGKCAAVDKLSRATRPSTGPIGNWAVRGVAARINKLPLLQCQSYWNQFATFIDAGNAATTKHDEGEEKEREKEKIEKGGVVVKNNDIGMGALSLSEMGLKLRIYMLTTRPPKASTVNTGRGGGKKVVKKESNLLKKKSLIGGGTRVSLRERMQQKALRSVASTENDDVTEKKGSSCLSVETVSTNQSASDQANNNDFVTTTSDDAELYGQQQRDGSRDKEVNAGDVGDDDNEDENNEDDDEGEGGEVGGEGSTPPLVSLIMRRDEETNASVCEQQWQQLKQLLQQPNVCLIYHLKNHYAIIFGVREREETPEEGKARIAKEKEASGNDEDGDVVEEKTLEEEEKGNDKKESEQGDPHRLPMLRQVLTARRGQRAKHWIDWLEVRRTCTRGSTYGILAVQLEGVLNAPPISVHDQRDLNVASSSSLTTTTATVDNFAAPLSSRQPNKKDTESVSSTTDGSPLPSVLKYLMYGKSSPPRTS